MRVLFDATAIPADRGGVGRYVDALLPALEAEGVDLRVVCQARDADQTAALVPGADVVPVHALVERRPARLAWEQTALPLLARRGVDLLHSPHYTFPVVTPVPLVVTLHDATFFSHPQLHSPVKARFFRTATRLAVRRAAGLVVPSRATRDEVVRYAGGSPSRFTVAYHGVDTEIFHPVAAAERARVRAAVGLGADEPYVAFLGTLEPRKNVPALIEGWVRACAGAGDGPAPALVLAGGAGWDTAVDAAVAAVPAGLRLIRTGYLPLGDLAGLLSGATVVAYPSLGEGFGLPVLEAMACGSAVLTTRELSLPEVGGDAVAYTGTGAADIALALRELLDDAPRRAQLAVAAEARAAGFTWREAARAHVAAYERALARG
ncbi:glycosyltransferase family 1 protein [Cellulomonas sp. PS-H5]|uniref:glycosyltransferase family 4 protein n=1 Tax=Cellulomonas sp. PS-H5 TaxID=2820400 RepID=UPI001C4E7FB0|nr:glycosyltransferase family 1 protein [Cellulomonas sp. PS-H5]MBW0254608.1 glycosyltransferase family 4 protein [Cellulomonas sp. PS-H5]